MSTIMFPVGSATGRPAPIAAAIGSSIRYAWRAPEVGDDAVLQRPDRLDRAGRAAEHPLRLDADRVHLAGALVDRDDRRLGEDDSAAADVDERVRRTEVDGHIAAAEARHRGEDAHDRSRV
jgi:hypothetical protein